MKAPLVYQISSFRAMKLQTMATTISLLVNKVESNLLEHVKILLAASMSKLQFYHLSIKFMSIKVFTKETIPGVAVS